MKNVKLIAFGLIAALSISTASLAAGQADWTGNTAVVDIFSSTSSTIKINTSSLLDNSQLIRLQYGFENLEDTIKVKQIIASDALGISMDKCSLGADSNSNPELSLTFDIESKTAYGTYPVTIILENTKTGQTTSIGLTVNVQ